MFLSRLFLGSLGFALLADVAQNGCGNSPGGSPVPPGGGNVNIITRSIPNGPIVNVEIGSGLNSDGNTDGYTYAGGARDGRGTRLDHLQDQPVGAAHQRDVGRRDNRAVGSRWTRCGPPRVAIHAR